MNTSYKVSIIIPVYNVENYIETCVKSVIHQDYNNIEIILVDDGSPDNSGDIIDKLAEDDSRIKVIHKNNSGVSAARNAGIRASTGDYIMFIDGDDWVDTNYVSYYLSLVDNSNCSIGMNKNYYSVNIIRSNDQYNVVPAEQVIEWIYSGIIFVAVWNKIFSRKLLIDNSLLFNEDIWYGEGLLFNIECLQYVDYVVVGEKSVYHQTFNPDSAMRKFSLESNLCGIKSLDLQKTLWVKKNDRIENEWLFHRYKFNRSIASGLLESKLEEKNREIYNECIRNIRKDILLPLKMEKSLKVRIGWLCYYLFPRLMAKRDHKKKLSLINKQRAT